MKFTVYDAQKIMDDKEARSLVAMLRKFLNSEPVVVRNAKGGNRYGSVKAIRTLNAFDIDEAIAHCSQESNHPLTAQSKQLNLQRLLKLKKYLEGEQQ